jgi:hypothetical protein
MPGNFFLNQEIASLFFFSKFSYKVHISTLLSSFVFFFHFLLVRFDLTKCVYVSERQSLIVLSFSNAADAMILSVGWQAVHSTTSGMKRKEK